MAAVTAPTIDEFATQLIAEDELGSVMRAHLHIEHHMDQLVEAMVVHPPALKRLNLDFAGKVHLLEALGVSKELTAPLLGLGSVRNRFAHRLNCKLTKDMMRDFYRSLGKDGKQVMQQSYARLRKVNHHPKDIWALEPKMVFSLLASTIRIQVLLALKEQTGEFPAGSVPPRFEASKVCG